VKPRTKALVIFGALVLTGCYMTAAPGPETKFLSGGNTAIADAIRDAAADWARHGLEIANYVTVDDGRAGVPVRFATTREIEQYRGPGAPAVILAATTHEMGDWLHILLDERLKNDRDQFLHVVKHELIHVLVPKAPHLNGIGVLSPELTSNVITRADMAHLARFTDVTESQVPFAGEAA